MRKTWRNEKCREDDNISRCYGPSTCRSHRSVRLANFVSDAVSLNKLNFLVTGSFSCAGEGPLCDQPAERARQRRREKALRALGGEQKNEKHDLPFPGLDLLCYPPTETISLYITQRLPLKRQAGTSRHPVRTILFDHS